MYILQLHIEKKYDNESEAINKIENVKTPNNTNQMKSIKSQQKH